MYRNYLHITELFSYDYLHIYTKGGCFWHSCCLENRSTGHPAWLYIYPLHFDKRNTFSYDLELGG